MDNVAFLNSERGVFVYQVLQRVRPLDYPSSSASPSTSSSGFHRGDLVSIDIVHRDETNTYLHLSDGSGWIPTDMTFAVPGGGTMEVCKKVQVEEGLWTLYVDNCPMGQSLRHHPIDSVDTIVMKPNPSRTPDDFRGHEEDDGDDNGGTEEPVWYETMQRVTCDRKVVHPQTKVTFYRVQAVNKWLMDRRLIKDKDSGTTTLTQMLIDAKQVHTGVFCFQALDNLRVRSRSDVEDKTGTKFKVKKGSLVSIDLIKETTDQLNGPFLRLSDGSGWLFTHKNGVELMKQVEVQQGMWELKIVNPPDGLPLQRHPVESSDDPYPHRFMPNTLVQADYRVRIKSDKENEATNNNTGGNAGAHGPKSEIYYRVVVKGTYGWIADRAFYWHGDKHGETRSLQVLTESYDTMCQGRPISYANGWTPDFVRGVVSTLTSLKETDYQESPFNPVLTFESTDGLRKIVYCGTRTVGILMPESKSHRHPNLLPLWYRSCTATELHDYLRKDAVEIMMFRDQKKDDEEDQEDHNQFNSSDKESRKMDVTEMKTRRELLAVDKEMAELEARRLAIVEQLKVFDEAHAKAARAMREKMEERRRWKPLPGEQDAIESSLADVVSTSSSGDSEDKRRENSRRKKKYSVKYRTNDSITKVRSSSSAPRSPSSVNGKKTVSILKNSTEKLNAEKILKTRMDRLLFLRGSQSPIDFIEDFADGYLEGSDSGSECDGGTGTHGSGSYDDDRTCSTYSED